MSATDKTQKLQLSQFVDTDKPTWRGDYNSDMQKIDDGFIDQDAANTAISATVNSALGVAQAAKDEVEAISPRVDAVETANGAQDTAITTLGNNLSQLRSDLEAADSDRYTKSEADERFIIKDRPAPHAVFVGTSNVVMGTWPEELCSQEGWICHNFAVSGMGIAFGGANNFQGQLTKAVNDASFQNDKVEYVFLADAANDARSKLSVQVAGASLLQYAKQNFPNARIIVIPGFFSNNSVDQQATIRAFMLSVANELKKLSAQYGAEFIDGSWTWHQDNDALVLPNEVHYTPAGYLHIVQWIRAYLRGSDTWSNQGWTDVELMNNFTFPADTNDMSRLRAKRDGNDVMLSGFIMPPTGGWADLVQPFRLRPGLRPARKTAFTYMQSGSSALKTGMIEYDGRVILYGASSSNLYVQVNHIHSLF